MVYQRSFYFRSDGAVIHEVTDFIHRAIDFCPAVSVPLCALSVVAFSAKAEPVATAEVNITASRVLEIFSLVIVIDFVLYSLLVI